jgi:flagellar biosynthesis protein FlhG
MNLKPKCAPRVIAITGGREGLGKSCIVVNLGVALAEMGKKVMILDGDLDRAAICHCLGLKPLYTILDVLEGRKTLPEVLLSGPGGIQIVPAATGGSEVAELTQAHKVLLLDELDSFAADFDFILLDTGAGLSGNVLYFNLGAQERIVVADQEPASVIDAYTLIKVLAGRYAEKRFKLLFNKISKPEEVIYGFGLERD